MPAKDGVRRKQGTELFELLSAKNLSFDCQSSPLVIVQLNSFLANFFFKYLVLGPQILDHFLLLAIDPAGKEHHHQVPRLQNEVHLRLGDQGNLNDHRDASGSKPLRVRQAIYWNSASSSRNDSAKSNGID